MALEIHTVELRAKDSMSPVFKNAGAAAARSAKEVTDSFARAGESTRRFSVAAAAMGSAIGASAGILADFSRAAAEDAAGQARLQQSIENTGKSYDQYSDAVDKAIKKGQDKAFSDDATREALVRLNAVTNDAGKSMDQLGLVMDFARARGISLADSASVIAKVMGGNVGILQRYGIAVEDGATATEALALIQARSAGQADVYANSQLGQLDKMRDKWAELAESIGANTGELQQFLLLLPGLSAGVTALSGLVAGMGGVGALSSLLLKFGGPAALVAGGASLAYGYSQDTLGSSSTNTFWNNFFLKGSQTLNALLPGNPYNEQKYIDQMNLNNVGDAINAIFKGPNEGKGVVWDRVAAATGQITGEMSDDELRTYVQMQAVKAGLTIGQYLLNAASSSNLVRDPVTGVYMESSQAARYAAIRANQADPYAGVGQGRPTIGLDNSYMSPAYKSAAAMQGGMTRLGQSSVSDAPVNRFIGTGVSNVQAGMTQMGQQSVDIANNMTKALQAQYGAYAVLFDGITKTSDATAVFNAVQAGLGSEMNVYQAQASEWTSELNAQESAYNILQDRQSKGIALTKEQTDFLNNYTKATEIGTGAVEDSTIAAGIAAQNMLLNKNAMDEWKAGTGELTDTILLLIEALGGVPDDIRTQITLDGADEFERQLNAAISQLNNANGQTAHFYIDTQRTGISVGNPNGPSINAGEYRHGGMIPAAAHGRMMGSGYTLVGDGGLPELLTGGQGRMVIPGSATRAMMRDKGTGGGITINGPVNVYANDPMQFQQQLRSSNVMEARW